MLRVAQAEHLKGFQMLMQLEHHKHRGIRGKHIGGVHRDDIVGTMIAELFFEAFGKLDRLKQALRSRIEIVRLGFIGVLKFRDRHITGDRRVFCQSVWHRNADEQQHGTSGDGRCPHSPYDCYMAAAAGVNEIEDGSFGARGFALQHPERACGASSPFVTLPRMSLTVFNNPDALPQLIGEFRPVDEWQAHINEIFYGLRGGRLRDFSQTFAAADYRLAHALAADYFARVLKREQVRNSKSEVRSSQNSQSETSNPEPRTPLVIHEWGCGNGNLAACFLTHLKAIDKENRVYPRVRYVLVDAQAATLQAARAHPDLAQHSDRVESLCAQAQDLGTLADGSVDRIFCNELWNDLPTKIMLRKDGDVEEEFLRPNLSEARQAEIPDWSGFVQAFDGKDIKALDGFPAFLEDIIWEREYRKSDWKTIPYRKTITDFLKKIDEHVLVPVNLGAYASIKEAKRLLSPESMGFSSFDAGTADLKVLNDPEKPCYGQFGGQYSFMVNFALAEAVAKHLGMKLSTIEPQKEYVGQCLATNVMSLMDLLATHPRSHALKGWQQDELIVQTIHALNQTYHSPYRRTIEFPLSPDTPADARQTLQGLLSSLKQEGIPDTIAYLTEEELTTALQDLEAIGYDRDIIQSALQAPAQNVDYYHHFLKP